MSARRVGKLWHLPPPFYPGDIMGHNGSPRARKLLRRWQQYEAMALEITFHHPDDEGMTELEFTLPSWPWRWVCWLQGHSDSSYGYCVICKKTFGGVTK